MRLTIRDAVAADAETIAELNSRLSEETEDLVLDPNVILPGVQAILADPAKGRYRVAESGERIVGQIMTTCEWSDWRNGMIWWIQSVYVRSDQRRNGIFSMLYEHVESLAKQSPNVVGIRLYVEKDNRRAQETYEGLGLVPTNYRIMESIWTTEIRRNGDKNAEPG